MKKDYKIYIYAKEKGLDIFVELCKLEGFCSKELKDKTYLHTKNDIWLDNELITQSIHNKITEFIKGI